MRFVPIKTEDQLDLQAIHRTRKRFVAQRTRVISQIRAYLLERGIVLRTGRPYLQRQMASILEDGEQKLPGLVRRLLDVLWQEWKHIDLQIKQLQQQIETIAEQDEACQRLMEIAGIGPLASTLMIAAVGNGSAFQQGKGLPQGWVSFRLKPRPEASPVCWVSASEATNTSVSFLCMAHAPVKRI